MPVIQLETLIPSEIEICFDLARSIDLHQVSTSKSRERAIAGITRGLIGMGERVTWEAVHFGVRQRLTSEVTLFRRPFHFRDEQVSGAFRYFIHDHDFEVAEGGTLMKDRFEFQSPGGPAGKLFNALILTRYMTGLLKERNRVLKEYARAGKWKWVLPAE